MQFDMIVDDSLFHLIRGMIVHDSFSVRGFAQDGLNVKFQFFNIIALFTAEIWGYFYLHYNKIKHGCKTISG